MNQIEIKRKAFTGVLWKFLERFIAQGISLIVSIVIARILSPTEYSVIGIVNVFFTFANIFITSGLNTALIQKKDADSIDYSTVLYTSLFFSVVMYMLLFFLAPFIANLYHQELLLPMIRIMGISLPITAIKAVWCSYISSNLMFRKFFFATLGGTLVSGVLGIYMAVNGFGAWSLIVQQMSNTFIDTIILIITTRIGISCCVSIERLKSLFSYSWKLFVSSLFGAVFSEISPLVIGLRFNASDLSYYTKGKSFPSMLSTTATSTLSAVLFPVLTKYQESKEKILAYTRLYMRLASFVIFPLMLGLFAVSDNFIRVVLTEKWLPASYYLKLFCLCNMFDVVAIGNCETIKAIGRSDVYLKIEIIKKTCYFAILSVFLILSESPQVLALAYIACTIVQVAVNSFPNVKLIQYRYKDQFIDLMPNLGMAVIMCIITVFIGTILPSNIVGLILQIFVGIISFVIICVMFQNTSFYYFLNNWKTIMRRNGTI